MTTPDTDTTPDQQAPAAPAAPPKRHLPRLELSATQLIASALAAITATIAASYLGVSGTVVGAAVASVLTAIGNAVYGHSLRSTGDRVREVVPVAARLAPRGVHNTSRPASGTATSVLPRVGPSGVDERPPVLPAPARQPRSDRSPWGRLAIGAIGAVAVFAAVFAVVTGIEVVAGRPISDVLRGDTGSGTTLFGGGNAAPARPAGPTEAPSGPTVTRTVTPAVVVTTPTVTRTAAPVTQTPTPTATSTTSTSSTAASSGSSRGTSDTSTPSRPTAP